MSWSNPTTRATGYLVTASNWNELVNDFLVLGGGSNGQVLVTASGVPAWATLASSQSTPANPSPVASGTMVGLAGSITPTATGKVLVTIDGNLRNSVANSLLQPQMKFGTGSAPANGGTSAGTGVGATKTYAPTATTEYAEMSMTRQITGLTLNTAYWLDVRCVSTGGGTMELSGVTIVANEYL